MEPFTKHIFEEDRILATRGRGNVRCSVLLDGLRATMLARPELTLFDLIYDIRKWTGLLIDDELLGYGTFAMDLRAKSGFDPSYRPNIIFLNPLGFDIQPLVARLTEQRGRMYKMAHTPKEAWALIAPNKAMPRAAIKFFR